MAAGWCKVAILVGLLAGCGNAAVRLPVTSRLHISPRPAAAPPAPPAPPPTWNAIFAAYFGPGSAASCGRGGRCHADAMGDATTAYGWLAARGYIDGTRSALVSPSNSCLRWFGGNMPPQAVPDEEAPRDLQAWVAAGAPED